MDLLSRAGIAAILSLLCLTATAQQPLFFGDYAPLTNTRYGTQPGRPELAATTGDVLMVWTASDTVRVTRLGGDRRAGHFLMESYEHDPAVVWMGQQALVVATDDPLTHNLIARQVDATGTPAGSSYKLANGFWPRLATNGLNVLMVYLSSDGLHAALLSANARGIFRDVVLGNTFNRFDVASNGAGFMVLASGNDVVRAFALDATATVKSTPTVDQGLTLAPRDVAIASNGEKYLAVWTSGAEVRAAELNASGGASDRLRADTPDNVTLAQAPTVVWAGDHYEIAYLGTTVTETSEVRLVNVSGDRPVAQRIDELSATANTGTALVYANGRTLVAWNATPLAPITVRDTVAFGRGEAASYGAAEQRVLASATSATMTMFVWNEIADETSRTYAGFRTGDGFWAERLVGVNLATNAIAATNGNDFMIVISDDRDWLTYRLSGNGAPQGQPTRIVSRTNMRSLDSITWNGTSYVVAGIDNLNRVVAASLSTGGVMSTPVVVRVPGTGISLEKPSVASNGDTTLIAWSESLGTPCFPVCDFAVDGIRSQLLSSSLQPLLPEPQLLIDNDAADPHALWTTEYTVVWAHQPANTNTGSIEAARIGSNGQRVGNNVKLANTGQAFELDAVASASGFAVSWVEFPSGDRTGTARVLVARPDTTVIRAATQPKRKLEAPLLALLPDGRVAHAIVAAQTAPPHHGAKRVLVAIGDSIPPPARPAAPVLTVRNDDGTAEVEWTRPAGDVNGYRIEYRVGDGAWNELERFNGPDQRTIGVRFPAGTRSISFRVRAFNDAGAGAYSQETGIGGPKRRAVR